MQKNINQDKIITFIDSNNEIQDWIGTIINFRYTNPKAKILSIIKLKI